jgi:hypothetical protein
LLLALLALALTLESEMAVVLEPWKVAENGVVRDDDEGDVDDGDKPERVARVPERILASWA